MGNLITMVLSWSLVFQAPMMNAKQKDLHNDKENYKKVVNLFSNSRNMGELLDRARPSLGKAMSSFLSEKLKSQNANKHRSPSLSYSGSNRFIMKIGSQILPIHIVKVGEGVVKINNRIVTLSAKDTPQQIWNKVAAVMPKATSFRIPFILEEAHAVEPISTTIAIITGIIAVVTIVDFTSCNSVEQALAECRRVQKCIVKKGYSNNGEAPSDNDCVPMEHKTSQSSSDVGLQELERAIDSFNDAVGEFKRAFAISCPTQVDSFNACERDLNRLFVEITNRAQRSNRNGKGSREDTNGTTISN